MNIFTSKNKTFTEGCRSPSPLARITFGRQTRKKTRERQSSDSVLSDAFESDSPHSSPNHSPDLSGKIDHFFNRSHSLPLFKSKTDLRYAHIFGKYASYVKFCLDRILYTRHLSRSSLSMVHILYLSSICDLLSAANANVAYRFTRLY